MMTKQRIEKYISLKREIGMLEDQIYKAECAGELVADGVKASSHETPYALHNVTIKGYTSQHVPKLSKRKAELEAECTAIENYIENAAATGAAATGAAVYRGQRIGGNSADSGVL